MPQKWKTNPNEWLSNKDILDVIQQYEEAFHYFHFVGPTPIDFDAMVTPSQCVTEEMCQFNIDNEQKRGKQFVAIVFNLDKHNESGSHWTSMFIDIPQQTIYYFDSAHNNVPAEVKTFVKRVAPEFAFFSNRVQHQRGNTECGMYSLYFIIQMLVSKHRKRLFANRFNHPSHRINDKTVETFRKIYFTPL